MRPSRPQRKRYWVTLTPELERFVESERARLGISPSAVIYRAIGCLRDADRRASDTAAALTRILATGDVA